MSQVKFMSGIFASFVAAKLLKNIIKAPRPVPGKTYGMPSSRSTVIVFMLWYLLQENRLANREKALISAMGAVLIYMKYHYREHSPLQLAAGAGLGTSIYFYLYKCK